uniref:Probable farnesyl diphosphate synthase DDB_G0278823 n=1 Tax=Diabrotica virgifera virgifera TaxID=50390 RepID=A0A6P7GSZ6_DIAVI
MEVLADGRETALDTDKDLRRRGINFVSEIFRLSRFNDIFISRNDKSRSPYFGGHPVLGRSAVDFTEEESILKKLVPQIREDVINESLVYHTNMPKIRTRCEKLFDEAVESLKLKYLACPLITINAYKHFKRNYAEEELIKAGILGWCFKLDDFTLLVEPTAPLEKDNTDIAAHKITWMAVQVSKLATPQQKQTFMEHYGRSDPKSISIIFDIYRELNLVEHFDRYRTKFYDDMDTRIQNLPHQLPKQFFYNILDYAVINSFFA